MTETLGDEDGGTRTLADIWRFARWLFGFVRPYLGLFAIASLCTAAYATVNSLRAVVAGAFVEHVLAPGAGAGAGRPASGLIGGLGARLQGLLPADGDVWAWVKLLAAASLGLAVLLGTTGYLRGWLTQAVVFRVLLDIQQRVCAHLLSLSLRFFHRQKLGDIYSRLTNDITQTQYALGYLYGEIFEDVFRIVAHAACAFYASPGLAGLSIVFIPAVVVPLQAFARRVRRRARTRQVAFGESLERIQQMLSGIRTVKGFNREAFEGERFGRKNDDLFRRSMKVMRLKSASGGLLELITNALIPAFVLGGIYFLVTGRVSKGDLTIFVGSVALMYEPSKRLVRAYNNLQETLAGVERVWQLLAERPDVVDAPDAVALEGVRGHVALSDVSFRYGGEPVLRDVSIEARPGEVVAIVGPSGAGKSTLLDLIARFYDPDAGAIRVDGVDVRKVRRDSLARHVAIVTQEPFLFNEPVIDNLRYGRPEATVEQVRAACAAANVLDVVDALPQGLDTVVGERGATLSVGQRQRLTIARALLKEAPILLLDEATSALDAGSERAVQEALDRLMKGRTTFVVAHRLSTVAGADRIVVLEGGRVVEEGRHEELVAGGGLYARLCELQHMTPAAAGQPAEARS